MFPNLIGKLSVGTPSAYHNLTLSPVLLKDGPLPTVAARILEEGLADGTVEVTEVSAEGHVPELRVKNSGPSPVLILDGEELVGAKQNRIVNVTILVPPKAEITIPVSCIEAGRWAYSRPYFAAAGRILNQEIRSAKAEAVTRSLKKRRVRSSDQGEVWEGVSLALSSLSAFSPTAALSDGYASRASAIDEYLAAFKPQRAQVGVIYRIAGILAGLDLFASEKDFARAFPKLLRGLALQALAGLDDNSAPGANDRQFLQRMFTARADRFLAVGLGEELRFDTEEIGGGALECDGCLIHLFAFPRRSNDGRSRRRAAA
jgi:hypothetical protein